MTQAPPEFIQPGPHARRQMLTCAAVALAFVGAWSLWAQDRFFGYLESLPFCERKTWYCGLMFGMLVSVALAGVFSARQAVRIFRSGQVPAPGTKVWRPTRIRRGAHAKASAILALVLAILMFTLVVFGTYVVTGPMPICVPFQGCD